MKPIIYPRIRCPSDVAATHPAIEITWKENESPQRFCGDNWCKGSCNLPALIIPLPDVESLDLRDRYLKASGSQVACGAVMQSKRVDWGGERILVPEEYRSRFLEAWWP
jgi:hypothetical protein